MLFGWQNYKVNSKKPLILYGAGIVGTHFLEKNRLKPIFVIDKNAKIIGNINKIPLKTLKQSRQYLRETEADIIVGTVNPEFIAEILNSFKQLKLHPKSHIYVYHGYDLKTKTITAKLIEIIINGTNAYNGTIFPAIDYKAKISQSDLLRLFPNMKNSKNIDEMFDVLEFTLWNFKWNKNRDEQLQIVKMAYLAYIQPILLRNQRLTDKYQNRIKILQHYFHYILQGNFSKAKTGNKIPKANANFKISVIVPMYNNELSIKKTFNSIIAQSYEHSRIEVIFIDNGSTDNSVNRIKKLIDGYKGELSFKVLILNGQDRWHARNVGVERAGGKYVIFLDAGSRFTRNALRVLANLAEVYKADIVQGKFPAMEKTVFPEYTNNIFWLYVHFISESMSSKLIRKNFILDYNYWWEKQFDMEALDWCKNVTMPNKFAKFYPPIKIAFSKVKCDISNKMKELYPLCNTTEQIEFYLKICRNLLCYAGMRWNTYTEFFKYKLMEVLPFADQILDKVSDKEMETKTLKIKQILRNTVTYFKTVQTFITDNIYFNAIKKMLKELSAVQNKYIFGEFKNVFVDKTIVLVAGGPTVTDFIPIQNAIYIGVNGVAAGASELENFKHIKFDFMFIHHRSTMIKHKQMCSMLHRKSVVFYANGLYFADTFPAVKLRGFDTREYFASDLHGKASVLQNKQKFLKEIGKFQFDITKTAPFVLNSVVNPAFHFCLFSGAKRIYLVGCDSIIKISVSDADHFYHIKKSYIKKQYGSNSSVTTDITLSWKFLKEIAKKNAPDTEIISVNPVGLKGLFHKDIYTKN
jgi:glycosyltransferase involved in cell wall biosynthesis